MVVPRRKGRPVTLQGLTGTGSSADPMRMYLREIGQVRAAHRSRGGRARQAHRGRHQGRDRARRPRRVGRGARGHRTPPARPHPQGRRACQGRADAGQPAPRRVDREAVHGSRDAHPRPHPGGQPRPHACGRQVRLHEGLQVLDVRHVVDPPGHHPCHRRPGPHHPHPRPHGRVDAQGAPPAAPAHPGARARAHHRGAGRQGLA